MLRQQPMTPTALVNLNALVQVQLASIARAVSAAMRLSITTYMTHIATLELIV